jgi:hypothetical protein
LIQFRASISFLQILSLPPPPFFSLLTQSLLPTPQCFGYLSLSPLVLPVFILRLLSFFKIIKLL